MTRLRLLGLCILPGILTWGCAPGEDGQIALKIHYTVPKSMEGLRGENAPEVGVPPPYISDFRLCVSAQDMSKDKCANFNLADYERSGKARIGGIPVGENRKVTFEGYHFTENKETGEGVYWCGEVVGISIGKNSTTQVSMFITACSNFTYTRGELETARVFHTATKLQDGRVLVVGGFSTIFDRVCADGDCVRLSASDSIEIYDPQTGLFESHAGLVLNTPRGMHTATLLPDGKVLVAGGCEQAVWYKSFNNGPRTIVEVADQGWGLAGSTGEIIDPVAQTVHSISAAMQTSRALHSSMPLPSGDVLLIGGMAIGNDSQQSATRFVLADAEFEEHAQALLVPRQGMVLLPLSGFETTSALIWGGNNPPSAGAGTFAEILQVDDNGVPHNIRPVFLDNQQSLGLPSFYASGATMADGRALLTGGTLTDLAYNPNLDNPEVLNRFRLLEMQPGAESITMPVDDGHTMRYFRAFHSTVALQKVMSSSHQGLIVLLAGGLSSSPTFDPQTYAEFFFPWAEENNAFAQIQINSVAVSMNEARAAHTATTLDDHSILLVGGFTKEIELSISNTAEVFNPTPRELAER